MKKLKVCEDCGHPIEKQKEKSMMAKLIEWLLDYPKCSCGRSADVDLSY